MKIQFKTYNLGTLSIITPSNEPFMKNVERNYKIYVYVYIYIPRCFSPSFDMFALNPNAALPCSTAELGLKKVKLGIDGIGEEKSTALDSQQLLKEKPPHPEQGVLSSTRKVENDDLQVNAGDCSG